MHCNASWFNINLQREASEHLIYANPGISVFKIVYERIIGFLSEVLLNSFSAVESKIC